MPTEIATSEICPFCGLEILVRPQTLALLALSEDQVWDSLDDWLEEGAAD